MYAAPLGVGSASNIYIYLYLPSGKAAMQAA